MKLKPIRCVYCGQFISYVDIESKHARTEYTQMTWQGGDPDFICPKCVATTPKQPKEALPS